MIWRRILDGRPMNSPVCVCGCPILRVGWVKVGELDIRVCGLNFQHFFAWSCCMCVLCVVVRGHVYTLTSSIMTTCASGVVTYTVLVLSSSLSLEYRHLSRCLLAPSFSWHQHAVFSSAFPVPPNIPLLFLLTFFSPRNQSFCTTEIAFSLFVFFFKHPSILAQKSCNHSLVCWTPHSLTFSSAPLVYDTCPWCFFSPPCCFLSLFWYSVRPWLQTSLPLSLWRFHSPSVTPSVPQCPS